MKPSEGLIEQVLILRCQVGDKDAFAELIERYQAPLRYFISRLLPNSGMTEDIFQDTWLAVIRKIHTLRKLDAFSAWLYQIARNRVYRELRRERQLSALDESAPVPNDKQDDGFSPDDAVKIHNCLEKLRPEHKEVLMLYFLEQMSYQQIAQVLDCNLGTVKSRMYYAKRALKREMEK
ncbi:MAG: RNA polymerase sigma factor [Planctomycetota bacterium]|jgi:RNA polymerase sigma-70 factor (ECF subfamily)